MMTRILFGLTLCLTSSLLWAAATVDGLWEAQYKSTGTPSTHIRIKTLPSGEVQGVVEKAYPRPGQHPSPNCVACTGANKDKPIKGMTILWGMQPSGQNEWNGGHLLNPETGKTYTGKMTLSSDGNTLDLRGYILTPAFGVTDTLKRVG